MKNSTTRLVALSALLCACGSGSGSGPDARPPDNFDRRALLTNLGENLLLPAYQDFQTKATGFFNLMTSGTLEDAQNAWRETSTSWQLAEAVLFGPAAMNERDLKTRIYSWPLSDTCAVDQEVNEYRQNLTTYNIAEKLNDRRGLDAAEYLLFAEFLDHTCPAVAAPTGWNELDEGARRAFRSGYVLEITRDLVRQADILVDAWSPDAGNYLGDLSTAGTSGSSFDTAQSAINVVTDAIFFVDSDVKDMKLGQPAGITENQCSVMQAPCLPELESTFAEYSKELIAANLRALELAYLGNSLTGAEGVGFDDFLRELGADELATSLETKIASARSAVDAIPGTLRLALSQNYAEVAAAHAAVRAVTDELKSQFVTVLGVDPPDGVADDND